MTSRPVRTRFVITGLLVGVIAGMACGARQFPTPWVPAGARVEAPVGRPRPGVSDVLFFITGKPADVSEAVRSHYSTPEWHVKALGYDFAWMRDIQGGLLQAPGRPNRPSIVWHGAWSDDRGGVMRYDMDSLTDSATSSVVEIRVYASYSTLTPP